MWTAPLRSHQHLQLVLPVSLKAPYAWYIMDGVEKNSERTLSRCHWERLDRKKGKDLEDKKLDPHTEARWLLKKAEGQRSTATYTEAAAKINLHDGAKERWYLLAFPQPRWSECVCGCLWVSVRAVPSLRQSRGFKVQQHRVMCSYCTEIYSLNSIVSDFSCETTVAVNFTWESEDAVQVVLSCLTRCRVGSMPNGFQVPTPLVLNSCQLRQVCMFPATGFIWLWDASPSLPELICGSNICRTSSLLLAGGCISAVSEECIL